MKYQEGAARSSLEMEAPLLWSVLREIARCRAKWRLVTSPSADTIEVWFSPEAWRQLWSDLDKRMEFGYMCIAGEYYGGMLAGAECFCLAGVPIDGDFTMRLRAGSAGHNVHPLGAGGGDDENHPKYLRSN